MKKWHIFFLSLVALIFLLLFRGNRYLNSGGLEPDNSIWTAFIGRDTTVGILPDAYANYFTYTLVRTNKNTIFKIQGTFPDTRYMSFNVYNLQDNKTQGSLIDYQIQTDSGKPNPFIANADSVAVGKNFTAYIVPEKYSNRNLPNKLVFEDDVRFLLMAIRLYDYNQDDFGGVDYPTVQALVLDEEETTAPKVVNLPRNIDLRSIVRKVSLPKMVERLKVMFEPENIVQLDAPKSAKKYYALPFHGLNSSGFIENNDNRYLMSGITKQEDEVYIFKFKAPSYVTGPENINQTDVRYWSFNLGNEATYNFNAIKDEDATVDEDGYVNIVLASKDPEIEKRTAELGYDFLEWNMPWKRAYILFRHMLANPNFEAQIANVPPIEKGMADFTAIEAQNFMGDYAPQGIRMSKADFLVEYNLENPKELMIEEDTK